MAAIETPTSAAVAASPAEEPGGKKPATRRHSNRPSRAKKAGEPVIPESELIALVEEKRKPEHPAAAELLQFPGVHAAAEAEWKKRKAAQKKVEEAEVKAKAKAAEEVAALLSGASTVEEDGKVVILYPASAAAVEAFKSGVGRQQNEKPAEEKPEPKKLDRRAYIALPEIVFSAAIFAAAFRLVVLQRMGDLWRLAKAAVAGSAEVKVLWTEHGRVKALVAMEKRHNRGSINHLLVEWYGVKMNELFASPEERAEVEAALAADPRWAWLVGKAVVQQTVVETAEEKAKREEAEKKVAEERKAAKEALLAELKKLLLEKGGVTEEAADKMATRLMIKESGTAEERLTAAAVGKLEFARSLPDEQTDERLAAELVAEQYAKAGGKTLTEVESLLETKKEEEKAKTAELKAEQEAKAAERARAQAKREAERLAKERAAAAKKAAKHNKNKGQGAK